MPHHMDVPVASSVKMGYFDNCSIQISGKYHLLLSTSALVVQIKLKSWFTSFKKI
jgi:hypothetical protein